MVRKQAIFVAIALAFLAGLARAETLRLSDAEDPPPQETPVLKPIIDQFAYPPSDDSQQSPTEEKMESSPLFSLGWPNTFVDTGEPIETWIGRVLTKESEWVGPNVDPEVQAAAYCAECSEPGYFYSESPRSFRACNSCNHSPYGLAFRGGWWDVHTQGDKTKIGEFQSLQSSEFWDADGLFTDGQKTLNFSVSGLDSEGTNGNLRYFGPNVSADVEYHRYLRRLDHDPLAGMTDFQQQPVGGVLVIKEDLNTGEDYAIRVQELRADFKGNLTKNLKWRLGVWGMRKQGERQVNAQGHCFSHPNGEDINGNPVAGTTCHVLTQRQRIDWVTTEIEPAIEAKLGSATFEYARTMRAFDQDDQLTTRPFDRFGFAGDLPYAVVPENFTEIDRFKSNILLLPNWDIYSSYYTGNTKNKFRDTNRRLWGFDVRTTVRRGASASLTGFAKKNVQTGQIPTVLLPEESIADIRAPINYDQTMAGIKGRWRPFYDDCSWRRGLRLSGGYKYRGLARENAIFTEDTVTVNQSQTTANLAHVRASMKWGPAIESHVRYRLGFVDDPLYGIAKNGETNSSLPTEQHLVEIGGTWTPADNFLLTGTVGFEDRSSTSAISNFREEDYPIVITAWYAPMPRWTFSGGLAFFSNSIDQDIKLGAGSDTLTSLWNYRGRSDVINVGSTYAWTDCLTLSGGFEFVRGSNGFLTPGIPYSLSEFSDVLVETTRWTAGLDYQLSSGADLYFRYQFFDFEDKSQGINSGTANMFLTGLQAIY